MRPASADKPKHRRGVAQPGSALAWGARGRVFESLRPDQTIERPDQTDLAFFSSGARLVQFAATDLGNTWAWNLVNSHHFLVSPLIPRDHPFAGMVSDLLSILRMTVE